MTKEFKKSSRKILIIPMFFAFGAALATLIPYAGAGEASILGYKAVCPFAPISTLLLLYAGWMIKSRINKGNGPKDGNDERNRSNGS